MMKRAIISGALLFALLAGSVAQPVAAGAGPRVRKQKLAPGVVYKRLVYRHPRNRVHVVSIKPSAPSTVDTVLAGNRLRGFERTSAMARRSKALVAINADYARPNGQPVHLFGADGRVLQTALVWGRNFGIDRSETQTYFGHPQPQVYASRVDDMVDHRVNRVNVGWPGRRQVGLYTMESKGVTDIPSDACSARIYPKGTGTLTADGVQEHDYLVDAVRCRERHMIRRGGTILSAASDGMRSGEFGPRGIMPGDRIRVGWDMGWPNVSDTVGGNPILVKNGRVVWNDVRGSHPFFSRHPRTGVGVTGSGRLLFMVVDGRWKRSRGMTLARFAKEFRRLGAVWALNLDGGGSTTMVIKGKVVNRPSDGTERGVSSALVLLPGADPGEGGSVQTALVPTATTDSVAIQDAASTGGLLSAAVQEGDARSPYVRRLAERFEAARR